MERRSEIVLENQGKYGGGRLPIESIKFP